MHSGGINCHNYTHSFIVCLEYFTLNQWMEESIYDGYWNFKIKFNMLYLVMVIVFYLFLLCIWLSSDIWVKGCDYGNAYRLRVWFSRKWNITRTQKWDRYEKWLFIKHLFINSNHIENWSIFKLLNSKEATNWYFSCFYVVFSSLLWYLYVFFFFAWCKVKIHLIRTLLAIFY